MSNETRSGYENNLNKLRNYVVTLGVALGVWMGGRVNAQVPETARPEGKPDKKTPTLVVDTPLPTNTVEPIATETIKPSKTAKPSKTKEPTATDTVEPTATNTLQPTATETIKPSKTAKPSKTKEPTATDTVEPTATNTLQPTATETIKPSKTAKPSKTKEPTATNTDTPEPTATNTDTPEPTATNTDTPEPTATNTPISSPTTKPQNTRIQTSPTATLDITQTETPSVTSIVEFPTTTAYDSSDLKTEQQEGSAILYSDIYGDYQRSQDTRDEFRRRPREFYQLSDEEKEFITKSGLLSRRGVGRKSDTDSSRPAYGSIKFDPLELAKRRQETQIERQILNSEEWEQGEKARRAEAMRRVMGEISKNPSNPKPLITPDSD